MRPVQPPEEKILGRVAAIHQPEAFPWLGFFDKWRESDCFILLDHVPFEKNYFQNRNRIRTPTRQGWSWLTIPVRMKGKMGRPLRDIEINDSTDWRRKHLEAIKTAYAGSPHYDLYWDFLCSHYKSAGPLLVDFNLPIIQWMAAELGLHGNVVLSSSLGLAGRKSELLLSLCQRVSASEYLSGISGQTYLDVNLFAAAGVEVRFQEFHHPVYRQRYEPFVPALSTLDLLFNHGLDARRILEDTVTPRMSALFT